jgi:hypothetical protein
MPRSLNIRSIPRSAPQPDRKGQSWVVGSGNPYEKGRPKACLFPVLAPYFPPQFTQRALNYAEKIPLDQYGVHEHQLRL